MPIRRRHVALVAIDGARIRRWAAEHRLALAGDLTRDEVVHALIQGELDQRSKDFRPFERPRACVLTELPFTVENGLLTPTLKLKRRVVMEHFADTVDELYD